MSEVTLQNEVFESIKRLCTNYKKDCETCKGKEYLTQRLVTLENLWLDFSNRHQILLERDDKGIEYFTENVYEKTKNLYETTRVDILQRLLATEGKQEEVIIPHPQGLDTKTKELLDRQECHIQALERAMSKIDLECITEKWELEDQLSNLKSKWETVEKSHWELEAIFKGSNELYSELFANKERQYDVLKRSLNSKIWSNVSSQTSAPRIQLPEFNGNYIQWITFKDMFLETIHKNTIFSKSQKLQHLKSKLKGEPERLVQHLVGADNYETCWDILTERYDNKRLQFMNLMDNLSELPTIQHVNANILKKMHDVIKECVNGLRNIGLHTAGSDSMVVYYMAQKLDSTSYTEFTRELANQKAVPELKEFLKFLETKFMSLEGKKGPQKDASNQQKPGPSHKMKYNYSKPSSEFHRKVYHTSFGKCLLCNGLHVIMQCPKFIDMDIRQRNDTVQSPVLVVELDLNRLEGTQLRALGLLSVFGFNVTYEVRAPSHAPGPTACSAIECRLLGHCYVRPHYQEFYCSCFEGYSGADCGVGPLCPRTSNMCKNGGTCRQMGPAAVGCICAPGYTGDLCEAQIASPECGIEECAEVCKEGTACDCNPQDKDISSARFETRLKVMGQSNVNISQDIVKQLTSYLVASNITLDDDIEILNISAVDASGTHTVWLRVWSARLEASALRAALARLAASATRMRTHSLRLLPDMLHLHVQPALSLHTLVVNQRPEIWEGSEFILTCMAYGSPNIAFTWYKDGVKINFNGTTRDIWTRTVSEDALGRRMSVLGVPEAKKPDSGKWSCAADDAGRRKCRALRLAVLRPPDIRLVPSTLTVNKGDNVSITCLAGAGRVHGTLGFSWARERTLLPLVPGREVWEDLYPAGSVLKLYNVQKSGDFQCQVSSVAGTNAKGVTMWALGVNDEACESDASHGVRWPKTAPGAHASTSCPTGHSGEITRFCEPKTGQHGVKWILPDFSSCVADSLKDIYEQFTRISYGYSWSNVSHVLRQYVSVLRSLPAHGGSGEPPLTHSTHMMHYLMSTAARPADTYASVPQLLNIYDHLLKHPDAFLNEEKIYDLQKAVVQTAGMRSNLNERYHEFTVKTKPVRDDDAAHFNLQSASPVDTDEWVLTSAGVELSARTGNATVVMVLYNNLGERLPSLRRSIEINGNSSRSDREIEFTIASQQVQLSVSGAGVDASLPHTVTLLFTHSKNYSAVVSKLACGLRGVSSPGTWSTRACEVRIPESSHVACRCRGLGTIALFTIDRSTLTDTEKDLRGIVKITVSLGGAMCMVAALLQLLALAPGGKDKLLVLIKAVTAGTHSIAMLALLECDTSQEVACVGALGWVCAACWCASCAALCAQPLLLHAELQGRATRAPAVALLAGVCTLSCLSARLWGGAPLQLGAAACGVCGAAAALLAALATALALNARRTLGKVTHKLPPDRRSYVRERTRVIRHTLLLLFTTSAVQAAGVVYVQPGDTSTAHVAALSLTALANGLSMLICYVLCDEECLQATRRLLTLSHNNTCQDSHQGDTSLSLYIKQGCEVESRGGVECSSSPVSPASTYWRPPPFDIVDTRHRRQSTEDRRADIMRCVEYKDALLTPRTQHSHALCDLIPKGVGGGVMPVHVNCGHSARVCVELCVAREDTPTTSCSGHCQPYTDNTTAQHEESCKMCVQSNPEVSVLAPPPIKSCLKNRPSQCMWSASLPSIQQKVNCRRPDTCTQTDSGMQQRSDDTGHSHNIRTQTDKVLHQISDDLDFLLNRPTPQINTDTTQPVEEAPS